MAEALVDTSENISNFLMLFHGTKTSTVKKILRGGFILPKDLGKGQIASGNLYGNAIYTTTAVNKATEYSKSYEQEEEMTQEDVRFGASLKSMGMPILVCRTVIPPLVIASGKKNAILKKKAAEQREHVLLDVDSELERDTYHEYMFYNASYVEPLYVVWFQPRRTRDPTVPMWPQDAHTSYFKAVVNASIHQAKIARGRSSKVSYVSDLTVLFLDRLQTQFEGAIIGGHRKINLADALQFEDSRGKKILTVRLLMQFQWDRSETEQEQEEMNLSLIDYLTKYEWSSGGSVWDATIVV